MPANVGDQTVTIIFRAAANSSIVNKRQKQIIPTGIYSGGYLTVVDASHASLSPLACEIGDGTHQVRIETAETINLVVTSATSYVVLRWSYTGSADDFMEILAVAAGSVQINDLVIGRCTFDGGGNLNGFNYVDSSHPRSVPETMNLFLKVEPTGETELRVRIRGGRIQTASAVIDISDQKSDLFVPPGANKKIYLVYVNTTTGAIAIDSSGAEAANPVAPGYKGRLVLAEIKLSTGDTSITIDKIKDVRNWLTRPIVTDDVTLEFDSTTGKLKVKDGSIEDTQLGTITSLFGAWTNKDSNNNTLVKNNIYKSTSDGFVIAKGPTDCSAIQGYTDENNPPTTLRLYNTVHAGGSTGTVSITLPVKKNTYWKIVCAAGTTIYWLPIGNGQCVKQ